MVTTSSSATRGSTTNISSYVRMGGESPPYGLGRSRCMRNREVESRRRRSAARPVTRGEILHGLGKIASLPVEPPHRRLHPLPHPHLAGVGGAADHLFDGLPLLRREGGEDKIGQIRVLGPSLRGDPQAETGDLGGAEVLDDRFEAPVAGGAPRPAEAELPQRQV